MRILLQELVNQQNCAFLKPNYNVTNETFCFCPKKFYFILFYHFSKNF